MAQSDFVHLHIHTEYSLLDGAIKIDRLVKKAKEFKMPALAMTDHGNIFGAVEFYQKVAKEGIKPIIGCEMYLDTVNDRFAKEYRKGFEPYCHLTLLAMNEEGYKNLCALVSAAHLEGFYLKPRIDKEILKEKSAGLIALSGCLNGEVPRLIIADKMKKAEAALEWYQSVFGDRFYLEVQSHSLPDQEKVNSTLFELSDKYSIPTVATGDCHYVDRSDAEAHEALLCIQTGQVLSDASRYRLGSDEYYIQSPAEMKKRFAEHPEAITNSVKIANRCKFEFDFKTYYFPKFELPKGQTLDGCLDEQTWNGFDTRWPLICSRMKEEEKNDKKELYKARINEELKMIQSMGFSGYFLIVADFINYAKTKNIPVGPGRGSAAGSLVAYSLKITDVDPLPYDLLFERFLNPERVSMPDMDIDFCIRGRDEVIRYVQEKYGDVSQIITFGKMKAKAVIRDVGRVMSIPYVEVDKIAKLVPNTINITLDEAIKAEPKLAELQKKNRGVANLLSTAKRLEGLSRHASTHAAGVVISDQPLVNFTALYKGTRDELVTQFDMKSIETIGLIKFDFLGLKTLTVMNDALTIIKKTRNLEFNIADLALDDADVYSTLSKADTLGVFQLESSGMRELLSKLKPSVFTDVVAVVALYRPGPLGSGMVDDFINRKHGRVKVRYELPQLEEVLKDTYGVIVYQEQVMKIASKLANFSLGDADLLRRAMGKKNLAVMAKQRDKFLQGCELNQIPLKKAEKIFNLMAKFAEYGFNKSHSAAYAMISYQTAFLKTHYTIEYFAAYLTNEMGNTDKVMMGIADAKNHGIEVLPPDVNESYSGFSVVAPDKIRFGITAVKNVGRAAIDSMIEARRQAGGFKSLDAFLEAVDGRKINKRSVESLIKCGAFDSITKTRAGSLARLPLAMEAASKKQREAEIGQENLFGNSSTFESDTGAENLTPEWPMKQKLTYEKESLGFYITGHPLNAYSHILPKRGAMPSNKLKEKGEGEKVCVGGMVSSLREIRTKSGKKMAFVTLEDLSGFMSVIIFPELYKTAASLLKSERAILLSGTIDDGEDDVKILANSVIPLDGDAAMSEVHIRLQSKAVQKNQLEKLKKVLFDHQGSTPIFLHFNRSGLGETVVSVAEQMQVSPTQELVGKINHIFGANVTSII